MAEGRTSPARRRPASAGVRRGAASGLVLAVVLGAGTGLLPAAAQAGPAVTTASSPASCSSGVATSADTALAGQLRPAMSGRRLGRSITGAAVACARLIVGHVQQRGLGPRAAVIAVTTAIAESTLHNHTVAVDHDSLGLFQQRPSQGWGRPDQLTDPHQATDRFLDAMIRKHPGGGWLTGDIGAICQRVQASAHPGAYAPEASDAQLIVTRLWSEAAPVPPAPTAAPTPAPTPAKPKAPTGPYQRTLVAAATELGPLTGHHGLVLADWNGDRRNDLVVVKGTGTATGRTEVRVMDGATNFSALLLTTATALGPTDARHAYAVADVNADARPDLIAVQRSGTASGHTEVRVVDGASGFQRLVTETVTVLPATDDHDRFTAADVTGDGRVDIVVTRTAGTAGQVQVQVLDGASAFQRLVGAAVTTAEPAQDDLQVSLADVNRDGRTDLVLMRAGTAGGRVELRVLDGASSWRRHLVRTATAPVAAGDHPVLMADDWNGDARPDLAVVQTTGTASGRAEVRMLGG